MLRLDCPTVVTELEGPRLSRLQPVLSFALLVKSCSVRFAHAHAKRKLQPLLAPQVSDALGGAARVSTETAARPASSAHTASASGAVRHSRLAARRARAGQGATGGEASNARAGSKATGRARSRAARSSARGLGRPPPVKAGRRDPTAQRGERSAREPVAASARTPRGSRAPGCSVPSIAWNPTGRASASATSRRLPRSTP